MNYLEALKVLIQVKRNLAESLHLESQADAYQDVLNQIHSIECMAQRVPVPEPLADASVQSTKKLFAENECSSYRH